MTMVRDESEMLPRWVDYYGRELGLGSLIVLDDNSVDGSTDDLPCTLYRLPPEPWKQRWAKTRARMVNGMAGALLACNDVVVFTDVDEFLVADPGKYAGLRDYLAHRSDVPIIAPLALEVMHHVGSEPPLDPCRPLLQQRRYVKFAPGMCKPLVKRVPVPWEPAFHAIHAPFAVDPDLLLLHLKWSDEPTLSRVAELRHRVREEEGRGSPRSFWAKRPDQLRRKLASWTSPAGESDPVPVLDVEEVGARAVVSKRANGTWRPRGNQTTALDKTPLRVLPERYRDAF